MPYPKTATSTVPRKTNTSYITHLSSHFYNMESNSDLSPDSEPVDSVEMTEDSQEVEITPEQTEQIVTFSMSTGNEDLDECARVLKVPIIHRSYLFIL